MAVFRISPIKECLTLSYRLVLLDHCVVGCSQRDRCNIFEFLGPSEVLKKVFFRTMFKLVDFFFYLRHIYTMRNHNLLMNPTIIRTKTKYIAKDKE